MNVLVYAPRFGYISETFISKQVRMSMNKRNILVCNHYNRSSSNSGAESFPLFELSDKPISFFDRVFSFFYRMFFRVYKPYSLPYSTIVHLRKIISEFKIDIVHCNYGTSALALLPVLQRENIKVIVHFHGYDASKLLKDGKYVEGLKESFKYIQKAIVVSNDMLDRLINLELPREKFTVVPYGVDTSLFNPKIPKRRNPDEHVRILHAGRLTQKKGVLDLIKCFANLVSLNHHIFLDIIGDGEEREKCEKLINELQINHLVKMHGAQPHSAVVDFMERTDIFVLNSRVSEDGDMEGFPNTILEAMATGLAVISTKHAGIPDAINHLVDGILVEERNTEQLGSYLELLISDEELRKRLGVEAREKMVSCYDNSKMISNYYSIYREIYEQ